MNHEEIINDFEGNQEEVELQNEDNDQIEEVELTEEL